jgi:hypothetical protein
MYAGIAVYDLKPGKKTEASRIWNEAFVPAASKQAGFKGALWLTSSGLFLCRCRLGKNIPRCSS